MSRLSAADEASGAVSFRPGPPSNRHEEHTSSVTKDQFATLIARCKAIRFFELRDAYEPRHEDGSQTSLEVMLSGETKKVMHFENGPPQLLELEREIESIVNTHRWVHSNSERFSLQLPVAGPRIAVGEDIKSEVVVREDVYRPIKPGFNLLMQAAGQGNSSAIRRELQRGEDVNAADETGCISLMIAAATSQSTAAVQLLEAGARVDQKDRYRDTALMTAAAVRFSDLRAAAETTRVLLAHGASVDAANDLGETALMWAARAGTPDVIRVLLQAGANSVRVDSSGHNTLYYLIKARSELTFDTSLMQRYDEAQSALQK